MCDHHRLRTQTSMGEVDHVNYLSENIGALFMKDDYCDVTLLVESSRYPAHRVILAARSEYFRALLYGGLRESRPDCAEIEMKDTSSGAFQHLLKYIYTSKMTLSDLKEESLLDVLGLAHQYGFTHLEGSISTYLRAILNVRNVCLIYDIGSMYSLDTLARTCLEYMDANAAEILHSDAFLLLSSSSLGEVLSRDSFCAPEIDIFHAVRRWHEQNLEEDAQTVMRVVRLPLMNLEDLLNKVRLSSMVTADVILDAIKLKNESRDMDLKYRGFLTPEENVATLRHGAQVIRGEMKAALLDGDNQNYDLDRGFTRHPIDDNEGQGIAVKLGQSSIINTVRLLLWDKDMRSYSYYIEVSMDDNDWVRIVDHTKFLCRSWQYLRFPATVARYIRIVGSHNTVNRVFHLVAFECMFSSSQSRLDGGIIVPKDNISTIDASACVIEGVSRSRNALINGDTKNYDWDSGYTCHQLGSGAIIVQLAQPYIVDSMRLLLWDCDGRSYSYYVEVSVDQLVWELVADKTHEGCRSWQIITFEKRPITFVKIVGTNNTANEVFHCVHFECPADAASLSDQTEHRHKLQMPINAVVMTSSSAMSSSVPVANPASPPVYATASIPTQPVVAMARVNPMPTSSADLGPGAVATPGVVHSPAFPISANAHSSPNRPDLLEAESDDSLENGLHLGAMSLTGAGTAGGAAGGAVGGAMGSAMIEKDNLQGVRIVWVDGGDGLGMENTSSMIDDDSSPGNRRQAGLDDDDGSTRHISNNPHGAASEHSLDNNPGSGRLSSPSDMMRGRVHSPCNTRDEGMASPSGTRPSGGAVPRRNQGSGNPFGRVYTPPSHDAAYVERPRRGEQGLDHPDVRPRSPSPRCDGGHFVSDEGSLQQADQHQADQHHTDYDRT